MDILEWSHRHLVLTGAAKCVIFTVSSRPPKTCGPSIKQYRLGNPPVSTISPDGAEPAILHTYRNRERHEDDNQPQMGVRTIRGKYWFLGQL
jgi:hypothetical protein